MGQPLEDQESGSLLCWNGEAWGLRGKLVDGNDAETVFESLLKSIQTSSYDQALQDFLEIIASITGPYAFVFYDAHYHRVFFGRDSLGRRSLAIHHDLSESLVISSICDLTGNRTWEEVGTEGIYMLDLQKLSKTTNEFSELIVHIPRQRCERKPGLPLRLVRSLTSPTFLSIID